MNNKIPLVPEHIDDERLLAFLDAEMDEVSRRTAQEHLDTCWDCRIRLGGVERSIENFFEFRSRELGVEATKQKEYSTGSPPQGVERLVHRCDVLVVEVPRRCLANDLDAAPDLFVPRPGLGEG